MKITFKIHIFYYLLGLIFILNGFFRDYVLISIIIIIHELGHITAALYYDWKIDKVVILPFGGITIFNEILNRPIIEELIIALMGPIFQTILFVIIKIMGINDYSFNLYFSLILIFNLLPIYPLDGAKILNLILSLVFPYKFSRYISIYLSYICVGILFIYGIINPNLVLIITILFLLVKIIKEHKYNKYVYNKFLFERYIYDLKFYKIKQINSINNFYRGYKHVLKKYGKYISEKKCLEIVFDNKNYKLYNSRIEEIVYD